MISKEELQQLYEVEKLNMKQISQRTGLAVGTVFNYMKKYGIQSRIGMTEAGRKRISESNRGRPSPTKGKHLSEETKRKISEKQKGKYRKPTEFGGHRKKRSDGYVYVYVPDHPYASKDGYVMEHILVMERAIGRYVTREEAVHHKNKIRDDNSLENLELMTFKAHAGLHISERHKNNQIKYHSIKVKNVTTGEIFNSCREGAKKYGVAPTNISKACKGEFKVKGCVWEYYKEEQ